MYCKTLIIHVTHFRETNTVYANYIGPSVMTDANSEGFPICRHRESFYNLPDIFVLL